MSTHASINVKVAAVVKTIYVHHDGYPQHTMEILTKHYNSQELAEKLINLGNLSTLQASPDRANNHSFNNPVKGFCIAYARDRGEKGQQARIYPSIAKAVEGEGQTYNYYWDGTSWRADTFLWEG